MPKPQAHLDLVSLIERHAGISLKRVSRHKDGGYEFQGPCPWCPGSVDSFLVWPDSERPHYNHVRGCKRNGDAIFFLQDFAGMSFVEACQELDIDVEDAREERERIVSMRYDTHNAPLAQWQERARELLYVCRRVLWSSKGEEARAYLHARGLTDETIKQAEIGYCPVSYRDDIVNWGLSPEVMQRDEIRVPQGIVIPWQYGRDLWKLSVRRLHPTDNQPKYGQVVGSCEALYLADDVQPRCPVMLVEGEFDALSVKQEASGLVACVATGSTTRGYIPRWTTLLNECSVILQSFDADEQGDEGAGRWLRTFPQAMRWTPLEHDANATLQAFGGAGVQRWVEAGIQHYREVSCSVCGAEVEHYSDEGVGYCQAHYPSQLPSPVTLPLQGNDVSWEVSLGETLSEEEACGRCATPVSRFVLDPYASADNPYHVCLCVIAGRAEIEAYQRKQEMWRRSQSPSVQMWLYGSVLE